MFKFDIMKPIGFSKRRIHFQSRTDKSKYYYFEFSLKHLKFIFNRFTTKYVGPFY